MGSQEDLERVAIEIRKAHGTAHLLVNNAALSASAAFSTTSGADFERIVRVNFFGVVHGCRVFLPFLREHAEGQILNVSSCFAWLGYPGKTAYASSKAAIRAFRVATAGTCQPRSRRFRSVSRSDAALVRSGISDSPGRRERENRFLETRGASPERVARVALDRLLANPSRILVGFDYCALDLLARLSPGLAEQLMRLGSMRARF